LFATKYIESNYGINVKNDFSGGNFPEFIDAIRSVKSLDKSDYVTIPKSTMLLLSQYIN